MYNIIRLIYYHCADINYIYCNIKKIVKLTRNIPHISGQIINKRRIIQTKKWTKLIMDVISKHE